jgi:hypothetical protein
MSRSQKLVLAAGAVMVAVLVVRPPFFGVDRASGGRTHAAIGLHWVWERPTSAEVYARLTQRDPATVPAARLADFEARVNVVRLVPKLFAVALVVGMGLALTRRRTV